MNTSLSTSQQHIIERLFKTFTLNTLPDAVMAFDIHYTILHINKAAEKLYGWTSHEAIGQNEQKLIKTRLLDSTTEEYHRSLRTKHTWTGEAMQQCKNGRRIFVLSSLFTIKNERGIDIGYVAINRDITEHKHNEYNLRFLAAAAKTMSSSLDYETTLHRVAQLAVPRIADWCSIELFNDEGKLEQVAIAHRDPKKVKWAKQLRKKNPPDLTSHQGLPRVLKTGKIEFYPFIPDEMLTKAAENPEGLSLLRKLGLTSIIIAPITADHKPIGAITLVSAESGRHYNKNDVHMAERLVSRASLAILNAKLYQNAEKEIKERRQTERRLQESEHQLDIILKNVADGITMQRTDGTIVYANDIAAQASGFKDAEDMLNASSKKIQKIISNFEMRDEHGMPMSTEELPGRIVASGRQFAKKIICYCNKTTKENRWALIKSRAITTNGTTDFIINIISDITEQKELENRKDNFISMASHELKTPITTLKIYTDLIQRQLKDMSDTRFKKPLEMMNGQINKLSALIADLLNLSKIQAGKLEFRMQQFSIDKLINNIADQIRPTVAHSITITGMAKKKVYGDPERIGQVLINLFTNAVKYSPGSDKIIVKVSAEPEYITVAVRDFGIGIEKKYRKKIFERFYQVSDKEKTFPGLGMGLYISQEIIKRHGGTLWVESPHGKGSVFCFTLPVKKHSYNHKST